MDRPPTAILDSPVAHVNAQLEVETTMQSDELRRSGRWIVVALFAGGVLSLVAGWRAIRSITQPILAVASHLERVRSGPAAQLTTRSEARERGQLSTAPLSSVTPLQLGRVDELGAIGDASEAIRAQVERAGVDLANGRRRFTPSCARRRVRSSACGMAI